MHSAIYFFIYFVLSTVSNGSRYGQKSWRPRPRCDQFDPPAVRNLNFDDIAGEWHQVRFKPSTTVTREPTLDSKVEWLCGTNKAIESLRLVHNPRLCYNVLREFVPIPGTDRSAFHLFFEELGVTDEWRLLHYDSEFAIPWGCFAKNSNNRCTDWGSILVRRTPNATISDGDLRRLDRIVRRATCDFSVSRDYLPKPTGNECRDWGLPQPTGCPKRY